jgi:hypothetical protein
LGLIQRDQQHLATEPKDPGFQTDSDRGESKHHIKLFHIQTEYSSEDIINQQGEERSRQGE